MKSTFIESLNFFIRNRYRRDYYINDSKTASGSRALKTCGDLNLHHAVEDEDSENDNDAGDSVSDLISFHNSFRNKKQIKYCFAHLPKPLISQRQRTMPLHSSPMPEMHSNLKRSQSLCSVRTYGIRKRLNQYGILRDVGLCGSPSNIYTEQDSSHHQPYRPECNRVIAQLERDTLHNDIRRNSFSSRRGTKHFVLNPLYDE